MNDLIFTNAGDFLKGPTETYRLCLQIHAFDQTQKKKLLEEVQRFKYLAQQYSGLTDKL